MNRWLSVLLFLSLLGGVPGVALAAATIDIKPLLGALACACFEGSEMKIDASRSLSEVDCPCEYAGQIRADVADAVAKVPVHLRGDRRRVALALESDFITRSPEYEELFRYDRKQYRWFLENVRCVCEACKATVYFSKCQLSCTPAVRYKRRARIWLALGFNNDQIIDHYLTEHNSNVSARERIERDWLLPRKQKKRGWMVPAGVIGGAVLFLGILLWRVARRRRPGEEDLVVMPTDDDGADSAISDAERDRLLDELDEIEEEGGW